MPGTYIIPGSLSLELPPGTAVVWVCFCDALEALLDMAVEMLHCPTLPSGNSGGETDGWMGSGGSDGWIEKGNFGTTRNTVALWEGNLCLLQSYVNRISTVFATKFASFYMQSQIPLVREILLNLSLSVHIFGQDSNTTIGSICSEQGPHIRNALATSANKVEGGCFTCIICTLVWFYV